MATNELLPVAAETPVATLPASPESVAPATQSAPLLPTLNASAVYAPQNVQQVLTKSSGTYKKMKLSKLEQQIAKANSQAELNQINIENTPVAMGVISGQLSQQSKLDTARLNAVTGLYNAKLLDEQRKEAERQQFITTYGADPNQRPKGMSKREFSAAIQGGGFSDLLTEDFKQKQLESKLKQQSLAKGAQELGYGQSNVAIANAGTALQNSKGNDGYVSPDEYINQRNNYVRSVKGATPADFDAQYAGMLNPNDRQRVGLSMDASAALSKSKESMSATAATAVSNVVSGLDSINKLDGMDTGWGNRLQEKLPFAFGARDLRFEYDNIRDILQRMRTGAAISATEESFYKDQIPGLFDDEATRERKLSVLKDLFTRIKDAVDPDGNMTSSMTTGEIEVMDMKTGKKGTIPANEMDNTKYLRI